MWFELYFNRPLHWKLTKEEQWQEQEKQEANAVIKIEDSSGLD